MSKSKLKDAAGWSSADNILTTTKDTYKEETDDCSIFFDMTRFPSTLSRNFNNSKEEKRVIKRQSSKDDSECFSSTVPKPQRVTTHFRGLDGPLSIARLKNGHFVVTEWRGNSISLLTKDGYRLLTFGRRQLSKESIIYNRLSGIPTQNRERHGNSIGELHEPTGILVTQRNQILVVDSKNHRLQLFSYGGTPITTVGGAPSVGVARKTSVSGSPLTSVGVAHKISSGMASIISVARKPSVGSISDSTNLGGVDEGLNFNFPYDVCTDMSGRIYVSDTFNHRISVLTENFLPSHIIGERGSKLGQFEYPLGLAMDSEGMLYVCDRDNSRVQKMTVYGRTVTQFIHESFKYPVKVAVDRSNIVYVTYSYAPQVVMFDGSSGEYIGSFSSQVFGAGARKEELKRPRGILVDDTGKVYVCDTSRNEIWLF